MRKALLAAGIVALVVVAYAAAGFLAAPRLVNDALVERAAALGVALEVAEVRTNPFTLDVSFTAVRLAADGEVLARAEGARVDLAWSSLWSGAWVVQEATLREPSVQIVRGPKGELNWALARRQARAPAQAADPSRPLVVQALGVTGGRVRFVDRSRAQSVELVLQEVGLAVRNLSTREGERAHYELSARPAEGGTLSSQGSIVPDATSAQGKVSLAGVPLEKIWALAAPASEPASGQVDGVAQYAYDGKKLALREVALKGAPVGEASASGELRFAPFSAELEVALEDFPLAQANRWIPEDVAMTVASGVLSAKGRLRADGEAQKFDGRIAVREARLEEPTGELLLAWQSLHTDEAALTFSPFAADLGEVVAQAPAARLVIGEDGRVNVAQVLPEKEEATDDGLPAIALRRLRIEQGTLDFADRSLETEFAAKIRELSGTLTGFSTAPGDPARVQLAGRVGEYGAARIRGTLNFAEPKSAAHIIATFRNIDLASLTPYIVRFAGYRVESGRVSAELRYRVREGTLVGENDLAFEEVQLGEKVERAGLKSLPLDLAVALLADANGRIALDIPVRGDLTDPQFDLGGLFAKALGNVVGRIASAPFRVLAAAFGGGGRDLGDVRFEPGSTELTPPAEEDVVRIAEALGARPRLALEIRGGYDAQADAAALRRDAVRRAVAERAGVPAAAPLDFGNPRVLEAAERLYLQRVGSRLEMQALREENRPYRRLLLDALAQATPVSEEAVQTLARARAETVRAALLARGVPAGRLSLGEIAKSEAKKEGVATELALRTGGGASAGGTR